MTDSVTPTPALSNPLRAAAVFGVVFGLLTLFSGGSVLFGPDSARAAAGDYLPFVVWFNFLAGGLYVAAGTAILMRKPWGFGLSVFIAAATLAIAAAFLISVWAGAAFEMRTLGALIVRTGFWAAIAFVLNRRS